MLKIMAHHHQLNWILLVLLATVTTLTATKTIARDSFFNKLEEGQYITGTTGKDVSAKSKIHCSALCLSTEKCKAYKYKGTRQLNCILINENSTATEGDIFEVDGVNIIYQKDLCSSHQCQNGAECVTLDNGYKCKCVDGYLGNHCEEDDNCFPSNDCATGTKCVDGENSYTCICDQDSGGIWTKPSHWNGTDSVLYRSFDNMDSLMLMEGTVQMSYAPLVSGQVNCAWTLNRTKRQWVDLGIHTEVCMTRPDTCGAAGGAISFWLNVIDCPNEAGILSSHEDDTTGFLIFCSGGNQAFHVLLPSGTLYASHTLSTGWTHIVLNWDPTMLGGTYSKGITVFYDGKEVASSTMEDVRFGIPPAGDGRIVVGRYYTDTDERYGGVQVDELLFFNRALSLTDVIALNNSVSVL